MASTKKSAPKTSQATAPVKDVLLSPRITEKASDLQKENTYVFNVTVDSHSRQIAAAVSYRYKVDPVAVRTVSIPRKSLFVRGRWGKTAAGKKAYVTLKEGQKIEFV